ncbi:MAG TPA: adenylate/guanylate cyclase domain-containing protein [Chthoniobacterales bacterium]|jgi:class 3 adenylate cyclase
MQTADQAWLETSSGDRLPLKGTCSLGRSPENSVVLPTEKVSRRHAVIHAQNETEFWLVDLGSSNGTFRNSIRIKQPTRLFSGDRIEIGSMAFTFHVAQDQPQQGHDESPLMETVVTKRATDVWLLLVDVSNFTDLCRRLPAEEVPRLLGAWLLQCADVVERTRGCVEKYVGDGLLAYWTVGNAPPDKIAMALRQLEEIRKGDSLDFRAVIHRANLQLGTSRFGNDSLIGEEINFVFRMEKLAGALNKERLVSEPAASLLRSAITLQPAGDHSLKGFDGAYSFYTF